MPPRMLIWLISLQPRLTFRDELGQKTPPVFVFNFCPPISHLPSYVTNVLRGYTYEFQESCLVLMFLGLIFDVVLLDSDTTPVFHQRPSR